jgi:lipoate---protein ligase
MNANFPACFVVLPVSSTGRRAPFYLAAEEWVATHLPEGSYLFMWQVGRTVVMGRNQVAHQEIDLDFCREHGIDVIRRKSGGGAIFADEGNVMTSLITPKGRVEGIFSEYANAMAATLTGLGVSVEVRGRNDIILSGKGKICGNAFYHMANRNIVHGTLLYDTDYSLMQGALRACPQKLQAKGVQSIRARVGLLRGVLQTPFAESASSEVTWLTEQLRSALTDRRVEIDSAAVAEIERMEQAYYDEQFLYGCSAGDETGTSVRVEGCGTLGLYFSLKGSMVRSVRLTGDFFEVGDAQQAFNEAFSGVPFTACRLIGAMEKSRPELSIRNLDASQLASIIRQITDNN